MDKHRERMIRERRRRKRRIRMYKRIGFRALFLIFIVTCIVVKAKDPKVCIEVQAEDEQVLQEQDIPKTKWIVKLDKKSHEKIVLDRKTHYTVGDFVKDLKNGKYLSSKIDGDVGMEGHYIIKTILDDNYKNISKKLRENIKISTKDGALDIKNKIGEWDGTKFRKYDGTYVTNDFVTYKKKDYYFDENGEMVTGEKQIDDQKNGMVECQFDDDGVLVSKTPCVSPDKPMIALTFDDGPGAETDRLLDVLEKNNAHATFFMIGKNASARPDTVKRMKKLGCELGNHTWNHPQLTKLDASGISSELDTTNRAINSACGEPATVFRPPYGAFNSTVLSVSEMPAILWSVDTLDWKTKSKTETYKAIMNAKDGDIVLMHDIHSWSVEAAIEAIPELVKKGYQLVTVSEMAKIRNGGLSAGKKYFSF